MTVRPTFVPHLESLAGRSPSALVRSSRRAAEDASGDAFYERWRVSGAPLRPCADVAATFARAVAGRDSRVLVLGATPELSRLGTWTMAVDRSAAAVRHIWPGRSDDCRPVVQARWQHLPCRRHSFSAAVGDGSLNWLRYPNGYLAFFDEIARVLSPGGRLAVRVFTRPEAPERLSLVRDWTLDGQVATVHALKLHLAHAVSAETGDANVPVRAIFDAFQEAL